MSDFKMARSAARGLLSPGNIDLAHRPIVKNADGSISTVRSMSFNEDGKEILVPTVSPDGRILSDDDAINLYHQTGQNLGMFDTPDNATAYAQTLHNQQEQMYARPREEGGMDRIQQLSTALVNAHNAGDEAAAKTLANEIIRLRGGAPDPNMAPSGSDAKSLASDLSLMTQNPAQAIDNQRVADAKDRRDDFYSRGIYAGKYNPLGPIAKVIDAGASAAQRAPLMGWDDEITAGWRSLIGDTDYATAQAQEDAKKTAMRQQNPVASVAGDIGGGLVMARGLPNVLAGRNLPIIGRTGAAALEAGGYGAVTGAGEAKPGDRLTGAVTGGLLGAGAGATLSKVGDALASRAARKAAAAAAPSAEELNVASKALYDQAYQSGVAIAPQATDTIVQNMTLAGGRINEALRPKTAGIISDVQALRGKPMDLQTFHELRQEIDLAIRGAEPGDERMLLRMRDILNSFADNAQQGHLTGPASGLKTFREADALWAKKSKAQLLEDMFDLADVKSGRYSQSGMENALRDKASQLYTQIVKGKVKGFTAEEVGVIRQLAKAETSGAVTKWIAKFAPRGVVSAGAGSALGASIGSFFGPMGTAAGFVIPGAVGHVAARGVDSAALRSIQAVRNAAASGTAPVLKAISNRALPLIGPLAAGISSQAQQRR
ncbi:hypothetical protein GGE68_001438 [Rhizobium leguminosarum]|uniref:hypothetical protein n=1 Tax=Rhizobium leguminosarum TaxID=384 RepID=UPI00161860FF|nr:hypothetical protein [Rhizobium leguminosarum]MBB5663262.1 hypothetical protein [Rhizobium leguminosarum]